MFSAFKFRGLKTRIEDIAGRRRRRRRQVVLRERKLKRTQFVVNRKAIVSYLFAEFYIKEKKCEY